MNGTDPDDMDRIGAMQSGVRLELVEADSPGRFEAWFGERARALIRAAESTQREYADSMRRLEASFNADLSATEERAEARLLELDRQLSVIHEHQRVAADLLAQLGGDARDRLLTSNAQMLPPAAANSTDLAPYVTAIENQLRTLRDYRRQQQNSDDRPVTVRPKATFGWRRAMRLVATLLVVQAITLFITTHNVMLTLGVALLAVVVFLLSTANASRDASPPLAEPALPEPLDLSSIVEEAEALYQRLTATIEADARVQRSRLVRALLVAKTERSTRHTQRIANLKPVFVRLGNDLAQISPDWRSDLWRTWQPASMLGQAARIGCLTVPAAGIPPLPLHYPFPGDRALLFKTTGQGKQRATGAVQSLLLRLLAATPPGTLQLSLLDPIGLGQNVAGFLRLADYDDRLISGKAATEAHQIERQLVELTGHMEHVIQTYLRSEFATIEDYNHEAGEIAEPYRLLTIFDFPVNFSETAARRLLSIIKNGPRCGVYTVLVLDQGQPLPRGLDLHDIESDAMVIAWDGERFVWQEDGFEQCALHLDQPPGPEIFQKIITGVGEAATESSIIEVPFSRIAPEPERWWCANAGAGINAPLGPAGARNVQSLDLGSGTAQHALVVGKTGSGKSTLLHTLITSLSLSYSPDEVRLYLIDFKQGVEFKIYAEERLPHARVIAIESEREFGLSVLQGLDDELVRRGERFRTLGVDNLADFRAQIAEPLPRILLLVDEFQEFFTEDDQIALQATQLLDRLVRQGRAFGLHVLLGTQTLAGSYSLARGTIDQMAVRIALQCSDADSRLILADDNPAARLLSRPGEAIYNAANGLLEGNNVFQVAWLPGDEQRRYLHQIRQLASERGYQPTEPAIVFEGNSPANIADNRTLAGLLHRPPTVTPSTLATWLGDPVAVRLPIDVAFRPHTGNNLLIVGQNAEAATALLSIALVSLAAQLRQTGNAFPSLNLLDFSTTDTDGASFFTLVQNEANLPLRSGDRHDLPRMIAETATEVQRRLAGDATSDAPIFLLIHGLHRARDLRPDERFGFTSFDAEPVAPSLAEQFEMILRDGPELGVHTIAWCDSVTNLHRSVDRRALREFSLRVAFQMSAEDSIDLLDTSAASKLGPQRALFSDEDAGRIEKFRPYTTPSLAWLRQVGNRRTPRSSS